jgi:galactokinase/mevalonate kinase-like predicted kinase
MHREFEPLLSVPPRMAEAFADCETRLAENTFATCDPPGRQVGSGGGTAHVLVEAWRERGADSDFATWLEQGEYMVVHGGGQSRRLPAYAPAGKLFIPMPAYRWALGQRLDQTLFDMQQPLLQRVAEAAPARSRVMIVSGDVLLRADEAVPALPDADVIMMGLWATPEEAQHFGVMLCDRRDPAQLVSFLQKPSPDRIREMGREYLFLIDVGVWLLSARAVDSLMEKCGWNGSAWADETGPGFYDLYGEWGLHLGREPQQVDDTISGLTAAVAILPEGMFHHFGTSRDVIESSYRLQNVVKDQTRYGGVGADPHPKQFVINGSYAGSLGRDENHTLWIENSHIPASWRLTSEHVLTGVPANAWELELAPGRCLDFVPLSDGRYGVRAYGIDDAFRGAVTDQTTRWLDRPVGEWFARRGIELATAGIEPALDIQALPLFPVVRQDELNGERLAWLLDADPTPDPALAAWWCGCQRLSATALSQQADLVRLYASRAALRREALPRMAANYRRSIIYKLDLLATARLLAEGDDPLGALPTLPEETPALTRMHDAMFRSSICRHQQATPGVATYEAEAFAALRETIVNEVQARPVCPGCELLEDQIAWGRSPIRIDLAGGWSDTPPYCIEHGGAVLNMALNLNGQPPIQAFVRRCGEPHFIVRSIDLGTDECLRSYDEIGAYDNLGSNFSIARAALALLGFHPRFNGGRFTSLEQQLTELGGGLEISLLAAVPKGSGLGTSSILAATLLGTLANVTGLEWDRYELIRRTSVLEQLLTSGGGWQDQVGGLLPGVKLSETSPGIDQTPVVRWLPAALIEEGIQSGRFLLYYTGITRVAHDVLGEIVRGLFLNSSECLEVIGQIRQTARLAHEAIIRHSEAGLVDAVRRSWRLNQTLDAGTNVPGVARVIELCGDDLAACKLLGAGGGGYLFMMATDADAAHRLRARLADDPPNEKARFVEMALSETGFQVTRS